MRTPASRKNSKAAIISKASTNGEKGIPCREEASAIISLKGITVWWKLTSATYMAGSMMDTSNASRRNIRMKDAKKA